MYDSLAPVLYLQINQSKVVKNNVTISITTCSNNLSTLIYFDTVFYETCYSAICIINVEISCGAAIRFILVVLFITYHTLGHTHSHIAHSATHAHTEHFKAFLTSRMCSSVHSCGCDQISS